MGKVLLAAAAYLVALAMFSRGPLGAVRILGPRLHQVFDLVLVAGLVVSPLVVQRAVAGADLDTAGIVIVEALAIVLLRMSTRTHYVPARPPALAAASSGERPPLPAPADTGAAPAPSESPPPSRVDSGDAVAPAAAEQQPTTSGGGAGAPHGAAEPPTEQTERPVPTTAWTLGVLAARARRRSSGSDRVGDGARRLGAALGRANRRRSD
jgi:hypothetical protein